MRNALGLPNFERNNVYSYNDGIEESIQSIGQAATNAARIEANK